MISVTVDSKAVMSMFQSQPKATLYEVPGVDMEDARFVPDVPLDMLDPWPGNRALLDEHVEALMGSIEREGMHQSLLVRPRAYGRYQILAGHHRAEALRRLHEAHPGDERFKSAHVLVKELDDDMAQLAVDSTNRFAYAAAGPAERATIEEPFLRRAAAKKAADPEAYKGKRRRDIAAEDMAEAGIKTSPAQIARNQRSLRGASAGPAGQDLYELTPQWRHELANGKITARQSERLQLLHRDQQRLMHSMWSGQGNERKEYLDLVMDAQDAGRRDQRGRKAEAQVKKLIGELRVLHNFGYEPSINLTWI